jgi:hypothetical protein
LVVLEDGVGDVEHAGALAVHVVEEAEARVAPPVLRVGAVLQDAAHVLCGVLGWASSSNATPPATCGEDIEVPLIVA